MTDNDDRSVGAPLHYDSEDRLCRIPCLMAGGRIWLTRAAIAALYRTTEQNVARQLKAAFCGRRLASSSMLKQQIGGAEGGQPSKITRYGVDAVLLVGERLGLPHGLAFGRWARACLGEPPVDAGGPLGAGVVPASAPLRKPSADR